MIEPLSLHKMLQPEPEEQDESILDALLYGDETEGTLDGYGEETIASQEEMANELAKQMYERQLTNEKVKATFHAQNIQLQGKK